MASDERDREPVSLEIGLRRASDDAWAVDLRSTEPGSDSEVQPLVDQSDPPVIARIDLDMLRLWWLDPRGYGQQLTESLFADQRLRIAYAGSRAATRERVLRPSAACSPRS